MNFFNKWKVLIIGMLLSIFGPVNDIITTGTTSVKVLIIAAIGGLISYIATDMRGQIQTIAGVFQLSLGTYLTMSSAGPITRLQIAQIIVQTAIAYLAASTGPMKSRGYEHSPIIVEAKKEGNELYPTVAPPNP